MLLKLCVNEEISAAASSTTLDSTWAILGMTNCRPACNETVATVPPGLEQQSALPHPASLRSIRLLVRYVKMGLSCLINTAMIVAGSGTCLPACRLPNKRITGQLLLLCRNLEPLRTLQTSRMLRQSSKTAVLDMSWTHWGGNPKGEGPINAKSSRIYFVYKLAASALLRV